MSTNRALYNATTGRAIYGAVSGRALYSGAQATRTYTVVKVAGNNTGNYLQPTRYYWDFGSSGGAGTITFRITNNGNSPLTISSIVFDTITSSNWTNDLSMDWTSGTINAGSYQDVTITFTIPSAPPNAYFFNPTYHQAFVITSNATDGDGRFENALTANNYL